VWRLLQTDDELWRAIAENTATMSALVDQQLELTAATRTPHDVARHARLMQTNARTISKLEHQYRNYTDELRRRYS
jgi:hypothetical protein